MCIFPGGENIPGDNQTKTIEPGKVHTLLCCCIYLHPPVARDCAFKCYAASCQHFHAQKLSNCTLYFASLAQFFRRLNCQVAHACPRSFVATAKAGGPPLTWALANEGSKVPVDAVRALACRGIVNRYRWACAHAPKG